ncbi:Synaptogenesis protein syg-2 [Holothuria leucospilota]|uniref:Synaptogenesis protein syg-2 n=1 Tax=Holothuria leucospilota TaxID=206669 RepID=A0A9Q1B8G5_HOLLE|nr:Synaptogenesis protein syg-2 [Holothuria leucospilota]
MYLKVNGIETSSTTYVKESEEVNITCHAIGARPAPQITWMDYYPNDTQMQQSNTLNSTFDVTSTLILNASKDEEVFICRSRIDEVNITDEISVKLVSYVLPAPILTVDDNSSDVIYIEQEESVTITCDASGAKPQAELTWMINKYPVDETSFKIRRPSNVFNVLKLQPRQNDTVKCTIFLPGPNETKMDSITFYVKDRNEGQSEDGRFGSLIIWIVISLAATFMTVAVCCVGFARRRVTGESAFTFYPNLIYKGGDLFSVLGA